MNLTEHDIDWIVAEVVRRLEALSGGRQPSAPTPIRDPVITLETLKKYRTQTETELLVLPNAVVTPAARDELKTRNIRLLRQGAAAAVPNQPAATGKLLAANLGADYQPRTLVQLVASWGAVLEQHPAGALPAVIARHAEQVVSASSKAVWFTGTPAHAVCLANRHPGVWAVQATDERTLRSALASVAVNVLVVDPRGNSQYTLRRMLEAFAN